MISAGRAQATRSIQSRNVRRAVTPFLDSAKFRFPAALRRGRRLVKLWRLT